MRIVESGRYRDFYRLSPDQEPVEGVVARARIARNREPPPESMTFAWFAWWHCFGCDGLMNRNTHWGTLGYTNDGICNVCEHWVTVDKIDEDF